MATELALARSFYSWVMRIQLNEKDERVLKCLPKQYPTSPEKILRIIESFDRPICEAYEERVNYWKNLFSGIVSSNASET